MRLWAGEQIEGDAFGTALPGEIMKYLYVKKELPQGSSDPI
jgi:hypothetical protein